MICNDCKVESPILFSNGQCGTCYIKSHDRLVQSVKSTIPKLIGLCNYLAMGGANGVVELGENIDVLRQGLGMEGLNGGE